MGFETVKYGAFKRAHIFFTVFRNHVIISRCSTYGSGQRYGQTKIRLMGSFEISEARAGNAARKLGHRVLQMTEAHAGWGWTNY